MKKRLVVMIGTAILPYIFSLGVCGSNLADESEAIGFNEFLRNLTHLDHLYFPPQHRVNLFSSGQGAPGRSGSMNYLHMEEDRYVVVQMSGPGAITRIWSSQPIGTIRIYIDNSESPLVESPFAELFQGKISPFRNPLVFSGKDDGGTNWCYVPIPFNISCRITLDQPCDYQIDTVTLTPDTIVRSFSLPLQESETSALNAAAKAFTLPGNQPFRGRKNIEEIKVSQNIAAGERIAFATLVGPAVIRGVRLRWEGNRDETGRELVLRIYWDGEPSPSVQVPLYDFFGGETRTLAIGSIRTGWRYCYLPMPFLNQARVELENSGLTKDIRVDAEFHIEKVVSLPDELRYFHSLWNRENETDVRDVRLLTNPPVLQENILTAYNVVSLEGSGHLIGCFLHGSPTMRSDVAIQVDQNLEKASFIGTGYASFFDMFGITSNAAWPLAAGARNVHGADQCLRLFLHAPLEFKHNLHFALEHGNGNGLRLDYASTAYWYQSKPSKPFPWMLPLGGRMFRQAEIVQPILEFSGTSHSVILPHEAENLPITVQGGIYETEDMLPLGPGWSRNRQLRFEAAQENAVLNLTLPIMEYSGEYLLNLVVTTAPDAPIVTVTVDNVPILEKVDLWSKETAPKKVTAKIPIFIHASERPQIRFQIVGKNKNASAMILGVDTLKAQPLVHIPNVIQASGPYHLNSTTQALELSSVQTIDGESLPLGYRNGENPNSIYELKARRSDSRFHLEELDGQKIPNGDLFLMVWEIEAPASGLYRFEIDPFESPPLLLNRVDDRLVMEYRRIMINDIVLTGEGSVFYDPQNQRVLPMRFRVPLDQGKNRLSWMVYNQAGVAIQPRLYGLNPLTTR